MRATSLIATLLVAASITAQSGETRLDVKTPPTTDAVTAEISPDGEKLLVVGEEVGKRALWLFSLPTGESRKLQGTDDITNPYPRWSPDSKSFAYGTGNAFERLDLETTTIKTLMPVASAFRGCSWNREGTILISLAANFKGTTT